MGRVLVDEGAELAKSAGGPGTGEAVEADGESAVAVVRDDVGGGLEDRLQELARFVLVPREEGLDEASELSAR